jgi:hypothetical protein
MKLTKTKLKQLIKEELASKLDERVDPTVQWAETKRALQIMQEGIWAVEDGIKKGNVDWVKRFWRHKFDTAMGMLERTIPEGK